MFSNEKMNEMFTSQESVENTQEQLKVIIEVTDRTLSRVNEKDPQQTVSVLALRTQYLALTMANHTISELYMKTLRLERELEALRAQSCRFSA
ncbi:TPA: hypothetical protein ACGPKT_003371 [Escherichia coli]|uniref:hypothetical protein n=1 Tax=Escherichia coli TaxID=562 RepID=UPI001F036C4C|nr:hypothetical protein [Escherichia coli]MCV7953983.1 hypothetical protein [Escherichia coli]HCN8332948.1 hypothetical protein [Escherichia coli]HCO0035055.1 hypothetical protein [Escherichia coli]